MAVTVLHADTYGQGTVGNALLRDVRFDGDRDAVARALAEGLYVAVAVVDGGDPHAAFQATQNGPDGSWSREASEGLRPFGDGTVDTPNGPAGYRASSTGDLFVADGVVHVAGPTGLSRTDIRIAPDTEIRIIGGGSNVGAFHRPR